MSKRRIGSGRLGRMLFRRNILNQRTWHLVYTLVLTGMLLSSGSCLAAELEAPQVDWAVGNRVYKQIEQWVEAESVVRKRGEKPLFVTGAVGAKVTLRYGGLTVGSGETIEASFDSKKKVDLHEMAAKATGLALEDYLARRKGANKWIIDIDLQIAIAPELIELDANASKQALYFQFAAGFHGLRMTHHKKNDVTAVIWPATALAGNMMPDSQMNRLLANLKYQFAEMQHIHGRIARPDGPSLERFQVIHLVRPPNSKTVKVLTRGGEVKPSNGVSMASVKSMGERLYEYLDRRISAKGDMPGTYLPTSDQYKPLKADIEDVALTAAVLAERTRYLFDVAPNSLEYHRAKEKVRAVASRLQSDLLPLNARSKSPEAMAHLMTTIMVAPHLGELKLERDRLGKMLLKILDKRGRFIDPISRQPVKSHTQAIIIAALVNWYDRTRQATLPDAIHAGLDALWAMNMDAAELVAAQPWMSDAMLQINQLAPPTNDEQKKKFAVRAESIKVLATSLRKKKIVRGVPKIGPADVVGGIDIINESGEGAPTPDWRTAHALAFLAGNLNDPAITLSDDRIMAQFDCTLLVRFLDQLMFDEASSFYVRSRTDTLGGVRFATWDNRLHVEPTAMTLLAITRLQVALSSKQTTSKN